MSKRKGARRAATPARSPLPLVTALVAGAAVTGAAWLYLVGAAIAFGELAVGGQPKAWVFTLAASLGAVLCLLLVLVLGAHALRTLGLVGDYRPRRAAPGRRRAR